MKVVIDTNVLWVSISSRSYSHWIFKGILNGSITLCVTTEILEEYAEIMDQKLGHNVSEAVLGAFDNLPNVSFITRYYQWLAVKSDPDDDKFVDCFVASGANYLVTEDSHFNILKKLDFPKIQVVNTSEFHRIFHSESL
ncbi:MAG TPA: putative toxin-antitoxin system toxin component, PIN family [Dyadobacter sp.]|nr:putative toxin-antitoxin system toxin component, PIN family [Dyadobacter sp.]